MDRALIHGIDIFLTIAREGSMRAAAVKLNVGAPAISIQLKALEQRLGVELFHRTTRRLELTEAGRVLLDSAAPAYRDLKGAVEKTLQNARSTTQTLRLTLSRGAYLVAVAPMLNRFLAEHPSTSIEFSWNEEMVDLERKGFHAGIRMGDVLTRDMAAIKMTTAVPSTFFAAPNYLDTHGRPITARDLFDHKCIRHRQPTSGLLREWWVKDSGRTIRVDPPARLVFDTAAGVIQAACDGHGIGWSMCATVREHIESGQLEKVLDGFAVDLPPFYLSFPERAVIDAPLSHFIASLEAHLNHQKAH